MSKDLNSYAVSMEFVEAMREIADERIAANRPQATYATVASINEPQRYIMAVMNGDTTEVRINCASVMPSAVGQIVRVEGPAGARYVADILGTNQIESGLGLVADDLSAAGARIDKLNHMRHLQLVATGSVARSASTTNVRWDVFKIISAGWTAALQASQWYDIAMPSNGTVVKGVGGAADRSVANGALPLGDWESVWYILPLGSGATFVPGNLRVVGYTQSVIPGDDWIMLCQRSGYTSKQVVWADGEMTVPWVREPDNSTFGKLRVFGGSDVAGGTAVAFGSTGGQDLWYRRTSGGMYEYQYNAYWQSGRNSYKGDYYMDLPHNSGPFRTPGGRDSGYGRFYTPAGGGWEFAIVPQVNPGQNRVFFLSPTSNAGVALRRMRNADDTGNPGTGVPYIANAYGDEPGTILTAYLHLPVFTQPA